MNAQLARLFDFIAARYDNPSNRFYPYAADRLVDTLDPRPGERVLDIATGTGAAATAAAQRILPEGRVQAIDVADGMLDRAFVNVQKLTAGNVDLHPMDMETLEFRHDYFDAAMCGLSLHLATDPVVALRGWLNALKQGGRLAVTEFVGDSFQPMRGWLEAARPEQCPFPGAVVDAATLTQWLESAGFVDIAVETVPLGFHLARAEEWWEVVETTELGFCLLLLDEPARDAVRREHIERAEALVGENGLWVELELALARARRPA